SGTVGILPAAEAAAGGGEVDGGGDALGLGYYEPPLLPHPSPDPLPGGARGRRSGVLGACAGGWTINTVPSPLWGEGQGEGGAASTGPSTHTLRWRTGRDPYACPAS